MELPEVQRVLGIEFPETHTFAMLNPSDPIHAACDFLLPDSPHKLLRLIDVNAWLHGDRHPNPWPLFLVAFAGDGCGGYTAYDLRSRAPSTRYLPSDETVQQNLASTDAITFPSFDDWYANQLEIAAQVADRLADRGLTRR